MRVSEHAPISITSPNPGQKIQLTPNQPCLVAPFKMAIVSNPESNIGEICVSAPPSWRRRGTALHGAAGSRSRGRPRRGLLTPPKPCLFPCRPHFVFFCAVGGMWSKVLAICAVGLFLPIQVCKIPLFAFC